MFSAPPPPYRLQTAYWLKHLIEPLTIFTSSAMVDHIINFYTTFDNKIIPK